MVPNFTILVHQRFEMSQTNATNASEILAKQGGNLRNSPAMKAQ